MSNDIENPREGFIPDTEESSVPTISGDWGDDDPMAIDDIVQQEAEPPTPAELPKGPDTLPETPRRQGSRLITRTIRLYGGRAPMLVLPADPNRLSLQILNSQGSYLVGFAGDDNSLQYDELTFGAMTQTYYDPVIKFDDYTGPIYARLYRVVSTALVVDTDPTHSNYFCVMAVTR